MNLREKLGLIIAIIGAAALPVGVYWSTDYWVFASLVLAFGFALFYSARMLAKDDKLEKEATNSGPDNLGADVFNYTGWLSGRRSTSLEFDRSEHASSDHAPDGHE